MLIDVSMHPASLSRIKLELSKVAFIRVETMMLDASKRPLALISIFILKCLNKQQFQFYLFLRMLNIKKIMIINQQQQISLEVFISVQFYVVGCTRKS